MTASQPSLSDCYESIREKIPYIPQAALVLGSGLGGLADKLPLDGEIPYSEIAGFPVSTVAGHKGRYVFARIGGVPTVILQGRVHYYEGYSMQEVVLPVRLAGLMGARCLFLTNAAGSLNPDFMPGDFMLLSDHISSFVPSPLIGPNNGELGPRFPDMSEVYSKRLRSLVQAVAAEESIPLREGVYVQLTGPNYETPAEVRLCRQLGGDAVGMSTACEAIAARHMGLEICGVSLITNLGCGLSAVPLSHAEVTAAGDRAAPLFEALICKAIGRINFTFPKKPL